MAFLRQLKQQLCHNLTSNITGIWRDGGSAITAKNSQAYENCPVMFGDPPKRVIKIEQASQILADPSNSQAVQIFKYRAFSAAHTGQAPT
jgi:hypothetical protein